MSTALILFVLEGSQRSVLTPDVGLHLAERPYSLFRIGVHLHSDETLEYGRHESGRIVVYVSTT